MKSLRQKVEIYSARVRALGNFLGLDDLSSSLPLDTAEVRTTTKELALTLQILRELLATCKSLNIEVEDDPSLWSFTEKLKEDSFGDILAQSLSGMLDHFTQTIENIYSTSTMLSALTQWRELQAISFVAPFSSAKILRNGFQDISANRLRNFEKNLDEMTRCSFQKNVRIFLSNQWLYPWVRIGDGDLIGEKYGLIFNLAKLNFGVGMKNNDIENILSKLADADIEGRLVEEIVFALRRVAQTFEINGYDGIFDIFDDGGSVCGANEEGLAGSINIIPGNQSVTCKPVLFAFAKGSPNSVRETIRLVREHVIRCLEVAPLV